MSNRRRKEERVKERKIKKKIDVKKNELEIQRGTVTKAREEKNEKKPR